MSSSVEMENLNIEAFPFILSVLSVAVMVIFSAIGATVGSTKSAASAAMVSNRGSDILSKAYLPVIMSSACFIYAVIIVMMAISSIDEDIDILKSGRVAASMLIYGSTALFGGIWIGKANKKGIIYLSESPNILLPFIIINSAMELPIVFSLILSITLLVMK